MLFLSTGFLGFPFAWGFLVEIDNDLCALTHRSNRFVVWPVVRVAIQVAANATEIKSTTLRGLGPDLVRPKSPSSTWGG